MYEQFGNVTAFTCVILVAVYEDERRAEELHEPTRRRHETDSRCVCVTANGIQIDPRQCSTMKSQIYAFLLAVLLASANAFGIPAQMALGGVNGGTIHHLKSEHR